MTITNILLIVAIVLFTADAVITRSMVAAGLAFLAASMLVGTLG